MKKGLLIFGLALMTLAPISASAAIRGFVGVGPYWGWGWGPYWGYPYYGYWGSYGYAATGEIKLDTPVKNAEVFIDGAYAGTTHQVKSMHLRPGTYNIEIRELGATKFTQRVYVVPGRTLRLRPQL